MATRSIGERCEIGEDEGIGAGGDGVVDRRLPEMEGTGPCESVDRDQHLDAVAMRECDASSQLVARKIQAGKVAGIGLVAKAAIDRIRASLDSGLEARRGAGRADQFQDEPPDMADAGRDWPL